MNIRDRLSRKLAGSGSRINTTGNARAGKAFTTGKTSSGLTFHQYGGGKRVVLSSPAVRNAPKGITSYSTNYGSRLNNVAGNPRQGSKFSTVSRGGNTYHRYDAEAGGIPAEVYRVKKRK
jgi:hypothetical protein